MSGPKSNQYFIDQQRLRQQEIARRAEEKRKQRLERQRRHSHALLRINEVKSRIDNLKYHYVSVRKRYPQDEISIDIPSCSVPDTKDIDLLERYAETLNKACADAENKLAVAEKTARRQYLLREIGRVQYELDQLTASLDAARKKYSDENIEVLLISPTLGGDPSLAELEKHLQVLKETLQKNRLEIQYAVEKAHASTELKETMRSALGDRLVAVSMRISEQVIQEINNYPLDQKITQATRPIQDIPHSKWPDELTEWIAALKAGTCKVEKNLAITVLRYRVQNFLAVLQQQEKDKKEATQLLENLPVATSETYQKQLDTIQNRLMKVIGGLEPLTEMLRNDIARLREENEMNFSRQVAGEIIQDTLEEFGYTVEDEFDTLFVEGGVVHFQKPAWKTYHVRLRVNPQAGELRVHMIKEGENNLPGQEQQDLKMETEWCVEYKELVSVLSDRGVQARPIKHYSPGAVPVQKIRPEDIPKQKNKRRRPRRKDSKYTMDS